MFKTNTNLSIIKQAIPKNSKIYYFDYPVYINIGDMLIWKGTEHFFKENKIQVLKRFSLNLVEYMINKKDKRMNIPKDIIIVCQGGGNFGDLYSRHQDLRILLAREFKDNRIVILPQTIFYENNNRMQQELTLLGEHKDLHLYVRDKNSYKIAERYLKNVYLCQDMAHALVINPKESKRKKNRTLLFLRTDKENKYSNVSMKGSYENFDWPLLLTKLDWKIFNLFNWAHNSYKILKFIPANILTGLWYIYVNYLISKAINLFKSYDLVITSRLHGHILACLMGKENIVIDNSYGKNLNYYECWTSSLNFVSFKKYIK